MFILSFYFHISKKQRSCDLCLVIKFHTFIWLLVVQCGTCILAHVMSHTTFCFPNKIPSLRAVTLNTGREDTHQFEREIFSKTVNSPVKRNWTVPQWLHASLNVLIISNLNMKTVKRHSITPGNFSSDAEKIAEPFVSVLRWPVTLICSKYWKNVQLAYLAVFSTKKPCKAGLNGYMN